METLKKSTGALSLISCFCFFCLNILLARDSQLRICPRLLRNSQTFSTKRYYIIGRILIRSAFTKCSLCKWEMRHAHLLTTRAHRHFPSPISTEGIERTLSDEQAFQRFFWSTLSILVFTMVYSCVRAVSYNVLCIISHFWIHALNSSVEKQTVLYVARMRCAMEQGSPLKVMCAIGRNCNHKQTNMCSGSGMKSQIQRIYLLYYIHIYV